MNSQLLWAVVLEARVVAADKGTDGNLDGVPGMSLVDGGPVVVGTKDEAAAVVAVVMNPNDDFPRRSVILV